MLKLTQALIVMQNCLDANDSFHTISFQSESLSQMDWACAIPLRNDQNKLDAGGNCQ